MSLAYLDARDMQYDFLPLYQITQINVEEKTRSSLTIVLKAQDGISGPILSVISMPRTSTFRPYTDRSSIVAIIIYTVLLPKKVLPFSVLFSPLPLISSV